MGRPALAVGGVALIGAGAAIAFGWWWPHSVDEDSRLSGAQVQSVRLDVNSGRVRINADDVTDTAIRETFHYNGSHDDHAYHVEGTELVLTDCGSDCTADFDITVPRATTVTGKSSSGDIELVGLGNSDVHSSSGRIWIQEATGPVKAQASSGDITVDLANAYDVQAQASSGNVMVSVPTDSYRVRAETHSGNSEIGIPTDPAGAHLLDLRTSSGDVQVTGR